jgi:hypothetical protein
MICSNIRIWIILFSDSIVKQPTTEYSIHFSHVGAKFKTSLRGKTVGTMQHKTKKRYMITERIKQPENGKQLKGKLIWFQ